MPRFLQSQKSAELLSSLPLFKDKAKVSRSSSARLSAKQGNKLTDSRRNDLNNLSNAKGKSSTWNKWTATPKRRISIRKDRKKLRDEDEGNEDPQPQLPELSFEGPHSPENIGSETQGSPKISLKEPQRSESPWSPSLIAVPYSLQDSTTSLSIANEVYQTTLESNPNTGPDKKRYVSTPPRRGSLHKTHLARRNSRPKPLQRLPVEGLFDNRPPEDRDELTYRKNRPSNQMNTACPSPMSFLVPSDSLSESIRRASPHLLHRRESQASIASVIARESEALETPSPHQKHRNSQVNDFQAFVPHSEAPLTPQLSATQQSLETSDTSYIVDESLINLPRPLTHDEYVKEEWTSIRRFLNVVEDGNEDEDWPLPAEPHRVRMPESIPMGLNHFPRGVEGLSQEAVIRIVKVKAKELADVEVSGTSYSVRSNLRKLESNRSVESMRHSYHT